MKEKKKKEKFLQYGPAYLAQEMMEGVMDF